ncbi:hypothetical protein HJG60_010211 [Phyllostomus discolor]|uniref:TNFR-Cys domain-containing protein n=1 Tax=Phyllostomus discolor TaxID=89673 RepID=A0A834B2B5_9CHIR|nr:hypothetical protein HJG60_010211 [Phyllostomus discolor]
MLQPGHLVTVTPLLAALIAVVPAQTGSKLAVHRPCLLPFRLLHRQKPWLPALPHRELSERSQGLPVWRTASCAALGPSVAEKACPSPRDCAVLDITVGLVLTPPPQRGFPLVTSALLAIFAQLVPRTLGRGPARLALGMQREGHRTRAGAYPAHLGFSVPQWAKLPPGACVHQELRSPTLMERYVLQQEAPALQATSVQWAQGCPSPALWAPSQIGHLEEGGPCPQGHFCPRGTSLPQPCPAGSYNNLTGQASCFPCPAGYYCPEAITTYSGHPCPSGFYCPRGTKYATQFPCPRGYYNPDPLTQSLDGCLPCPPGHYCRQENLTQASGLCDAGWFCMLAAWTPRPFDLDNYTSNNCLCPATATGGKCPAGSFCPKGSSEPIPCPPGSFCATSGLSTPTGSCQAGYFCAGGAATPTPEDKLTRALCPPGTFCQAAGPCPQGHYCPRGSAMPQPCPPGTFSTHVKLGSEAACSPCPPGHYCDSPGLTSPSGLCSPGFFCLGRALIPNSSLGDQTGGPCPAGHFCPPGTVTPRPCPAGTHSSLAAQGHCEPCPEGFFCLANTSSVVGNECPAGHYCPVSTSFASQFPCPRGTYKPQRRGVQQSDCIPCEPGNEASTVSCLGWQQCLGPVVQGSTALGDHLSQIPQMGSQETSALQATFVPRAAPGPLRAPQVMCGPAGSFLPFSGAISLDNCQPCPAGWFCSQAGLSSPEAACEGGWFCPSASVSGHSPGTLCPTGHFCPQGSLEPWLCSPGKYQDEPGQTVCKTCPAGKFCPFGIQGPGARLIWPVDCPPGYYCPLGTWSPTQHPCPRGTFRERPGAHSPEDCRPCPAGQFCSDSGTGKRFPDGPCAAGYYCPPGQTSATPSSFQCPRGFYCPEGSSQPRACESGTFQPQEAKGFCEPCPAGFYCEASGTGATANGPSLCLRGYFCPLGSHSAMAHPCPRGTFGPRRGAVALLDCELCPAGMFCSLEGLSQPSGFCYATHYCAGGAVSPTPIKQKVEAPGLPGNDICPPGFFCPRGTGVPVPCRPGFYSSAPGLASEDQCQPCPPGHYCNSPGLSHTLEAGLCNAGYICLGGSTIPSPSDGTHGYRCPPGFRCPPGAHSELPCEPGTFSPLFGADTCLPCPEGTYCPKLATMEPTTCPKGHYCPAGTSSALPCPAGTLNPREGALHPRACQPCPTGRYCPGEGNGHPKGLCSAGYYCEGGSASPTPRRNSAFPINGPCPLGHYCPKGTLHPVPCPLGTMRSSPGGISQGSCEPCPAGSFCPSMGLSSPNGSCVVGSECPVDPKASGPMALPCPEGHFCQPGAAWPAPCHRGEYQPSLGSDTCLSCPPGFHCPNPGSRVPRLCPAHAYCPAGVWSPLPCPPGTFTPQDTVGLREKGDCSVCPPGHYCRGGQVWGKCPAGYFCLPGTAGLPTQCPRDSETLCPRGQLCARPCPAGSNVNTCASGFYCPEGSGEPTLCPPHTVAATPKAKQQEDCEPCPAGRWCQAGDPATYPCPAGHYCPGGRETHAGAPQACPEHTYLAAEGGQSRAECRPCPAGYHCPTPGLSSLEGQLCPPGHWCPGGQGAFLCPPGTFRTEPGAASWEDCELCPPGYYCPTPELRGHANVFAIPCRAGSECPAGTVAEVTCRAGSYCGPQTGVPPLCPGGYACPAGSSTYTGPGQLCVFPYYCPPGSTHPHACPAGSEALNQSGLRVSEDTCCRLCDAGTYHSQALDTLPCQPCPAGFSCQQGTERYHSQPCPMGHYCPSGTHSPRPCPAGTFRNSSQAKVAGECLPCPAGTFSAGPGQTGCLPCGSSAFSLPGASQCTCRGLNRVFQKSDGSCICQAGHKSYNKRGLESDENNSNEDCHPQVAERCSPGDIRLAATGKCVSPQQHNCSSFCHLVGGELSAELGICQCREYVSAEELCDAQCLARAPQLSLAWGPHRELILSMKGEAGDSTQREVASTLGPDQFFHGSARVHLVQCGPHGIVGFLISREDTLGSFLGPPVSSPRLQRRHGTAGPEHPISQDSSVHPQIPNPVICLVEGDVILFQLLIFPHNRSASHYPVYQKQHLFNSNPHWDSGAFRRLSHLVQETHLNFSRFAHQFLDPGTYVFQDNGLPESMAVVLVKKNGVACGPGQAPMQPSSPYQLARHGIIRHRMPHLGPNWTAITGVLLAVGLATALLMGLGLMLRPSLAQTFPLRAQRPQWRVLREPHVPTACACLRDSPPFHEGQCPQGSEGADSQDRAITQGTGRLLPTGTLGDFSIRTLYDKLEDQSLHVVAQLSKHRSDALAFYSGASQQLWGLKDLLQGLSTSETGAKASTRTDISQCEESWGHTTASPREHWQLPPGCIPSVFPLGFQLELDGVILALASALSHACEPPAGASSKVSGQINEQPVSTCQQDPQLVNDVHLKPLSLTSDEEHQNASPQQDQRPGKYPQNDSKGGAMSSGSRHGHVHGGFPELQRMIWQAEDTLDELNEEFFWLTAHALELQREEDNPGQPPPSKSSTFVVVPTVFPFVWQEDKPNPAEADGPDRRYPRTWALKSDQALILKVRRAHLAQRIEDLEWELSLLLQVADGTMCS